MRKMTIIMLSILTLILGLGLFLLSHSGNPKPYTDKSAVVLEASISEKIFLNINHSKQGLFIKSKNRNNPVLLYLHGGLPDYFLNQNHPSGLEEIFTVVWWEQRGAGISYDSNSNVKPDLRQLIQDTKSLSKYLIKRFGKRKIYLMGHSGGTFIGIHAAAEAPELFHAYLAVAQITNQFQSEKMACSLMLKHYQKIGDKQLSEKLLSVQITADTLPDDYLKIRDYAMHKSGNGTMRNMKSIVTGLFFPSLMFNEYSMAEKFKLWQAKAKSGVSSVWDVILKTDVTAKIPELKIPVYFFHGVHDYTVSYPLAKAYYEKIKAPAKGFYSFSASAHSPLFEEPEKFRGIIRNEILKKTDN